MASSSPTPTSSPFSYREVCFPSLHVEIIACIQCEFPHTKSTFQKVPNNSKKNPKAMLYGQGSNPSVSLTKMPTYFNITFL
jgi:hypothetical protein